MDHYKQPKGQVGKGIKTFQCRNPTCLQDFFFCCAIFSQAQPLARFFFFVGREVTPLLISIGLPPKEWSEW